MSYCELPEFYDDKEVVARKEYKCCECSASIKKGEKHLSWKGNWPSVDGFDYGRQHLECRDLCVYIRDKFQDGECIGFGSMKEFWSEYDCKEYKHKEPYKKLRQLKAKIILRERRTKEPLAQRGRNG